MSRPPRELTKAEARANWWHYHWYYVLLIACAVLGAAYFAWHRLTEVQPDYRVAVVGRQDPSAELLADLETALEAAGTDVTGDGSVHAAVKSIWLDLRYNGQDTSIQELMMSSQEKLNADFFTKESLLFVTDDPEALEAAYGCFRRLDGTDPGEGETITRTEFAVPLKDTALSALAEADGRTWYLCRRITDGVDADALAAADALWEDLLQK